MRCYHYHLIFKKDILMPKRVEQLYLRIFWSPWKLHPRLVDALTLSQFCSSLVGFASAMICDSFPNPQLHYSISPFPQKGNSKQ